MKKMKLWSIMMLVVMMIPLVLACNKDDSNEFKDNETWTVYVRNDPSDTNVRVVHVIDNSKAQKLKWNASFSNPQDANYFTFYPTKGIGSGEIKARMKIPGMQGATFEMHIEFENASGKQSESNMFVYFPY